MKKFILIGFVLVNAIIFFDGCKKEDKSIAPSTKHVQTKTLTHPIKPTTTYQYSYYTDWKIKPILRITDNDTSSETYFYDNERLSYKLILENMQESSDTVSYKYNGNTILVFWHQNGVKHKIFLNKLNNNGEPEQEEIYDRYTGELYSTTENQWKNSNLSGSVSTFADSGKQATSNFTYFTDVYNPDKDLYLTSFGRSLNYISKIETSTDPDFLVQILEKEDQYPIKVEYGSYTIAYKYY